MLQKLLRKNRQNYRSSKLRIIAHNKCIEVIMFFFFSLFHLFSVAIELLVLEVMHENRAKVYTSTLPWQLQSQLIYICALFGLISSYITTTCHKIKLER